MGAPPPVDADEVVQKSLGATPQQRRSSFSEQTAVAGSFFYGFDRMAGVPRFYIFLKTSLGSR